jgi:hypothetical protein
MDSARTAGHRLKIQLRPGTPKLQIRQLSAIIFMHSPVLVPCAAPSEQRAELLDKVSLADVLAENSTGFSTHLLITDGSISATMLIDFGGGLISSAVPAL